LRLAGPVPVFTELHAFARKNTRIGFSLPDVGRENCEMLHGSRRIFLFLLLASLSAPAVAAGWAGVDTDQSAIARFYSSPNGIRVEIVGLTNPNPDSCSSFANWYRLPFGVVNYEATASLLLAAKAIGQRLKLYADGCEANEPKIAAVLIQ
jgi:hypothetical protein